MTVSGAPRPTTDSISEQRYRSLIESAHDGIFVCGPDARIQLANPAFAAICGRTVDEVIGMSVADLIAPAQLAAKPLGWDALRQTGRLETLRTIRRPDGSEAYTEVGVTLLTDGCAQCVVHDVTERQRLEERLQASERRFRSIFDAAFEFVGLLTPDGIVLEANQAALAFAGVTADAVRGRAFWETPWWRNAPDDQARLRDAVARAAAGEFVRFDTTHRGADDRTMTVDFSLTPVRDERGVVTMLIPEGRDVTEARRMGERLRESEEMFRLAFEHSAIGMALVDLDGRWRRVNRALCEIVGYSEAELLARTFQDITHPDDLDTDLGLMRELLDGTRTWYALEKRYRHKDGGTRHVLLHGSVVRSAAGAPRFFVAQVKDVTARRAADEALERQRVELARSNAELEQFAYVASHDLQEPLRAVVGYSELLATRYAPALDERARSYLRHVADGATRMQALVRDLLTLSRVGTNARPFAPVDLGALFDEVATDMAVAIAEAGATVTRDALPVIDGDAAQLRQLVLNLLGNALKFRRPGVAPRVHVGVVGSAPNGSAWTLEMRDNGIGVDPRFAERVFVIFQRLHTREEYPGTGIGLAICRKVVERHGGRIWVEPAPGGGSAFRFTLPCRGERNDDASRTRQPS